MTGLHTQPCSRGHHRSSRVWPVETFHPWGSSFGGPPPTHQSCRNPTLAKCGGEAQHLEKLEVWSPPGLPNV
jgi:hypothetical protein